MKTRNKVGLYGLILLMGIFFPMPAFAADLAAVDAMNDSGQPMDPITGSLGLADASLQAPHLGANSQSDHQAQIFRVQGSVKILKAGSADWIPAEKSMRIAVGDQILTGPDSYLEIAYDDRFLNIARIDAGTKAEFQSIEPTIVRLEDGSIFSALDGLKGSSYQVATPVAVAAVRGTHFEVNYEAMTQKFDAAVFPDVREHISAVEISNDQGLSLLIKEGTEADLAGGVASEPRPIEPEKILAIQEKLEALLENVDPSLRILSEEPAAQEEDQENKDPALMNDSGDDNKKLPGGGDGGDLGGENPQDPDASSPDSPLLKTENSESSPQDDSQVDAVMDSMIPSESAAPVEEKKSSAETANGEGAKDSEESEKSDGAAPAPDSASKLQGAPKADTETMVKFLNAGGAFEGKGATSEDLNKVFSNMQFDGKQTDVLTHAFQNRGGDEGRLQFESPTFNDLGPRSDDFMPKADDFVPRIDPDDVRPRLEDFKPHIETIDPFQIFINHGFLMELYSVLGSNYDPIYTTDTFLHLGTAQDNYQRQGSSSSPLVNTDTNFNNEVNLKVIKVENVNENGIDVAKVNYQIIRDGQSDPSKTGFAFCQEGLTCTNDPPQSP